MVKKLYSKDIKCIEVDQVKSLNIRDILVFAKRQTNIDEYLPSYEYNKFHNRDWLCNAVNTINTKNLMNSCKCFESKRETNAFKQRERS